MTSLAVAVAEAFAPPASKVVVTGSGFSTDEREVIRAWAQRLGAEYSGDLVCRKTTHLVSKDLLKQYASAKYYKALEWGIAIVSYRWLWDSMNAGRVLPLAPYKSDRPGPADAALRDAVTLIRKKQQVEATAQAAAAAAPSRTARQPLQLLSANTTSERAAATGGTAGDDAAHVAAGPGKPKSEKRPRELQPLAPHGPDPDEFTFDVPLCPAGGAPAPSPKLCGGALAAAHAAAPLLMQMQHSGSEAEEGGGRDGQDDEEGDEELVCETQAQQQPSPSASSCKGPIAVAAADTAVAVAACGTSKTSDDKHHDQEQQPQPPASAASSSPSVEVGLSALGGTETISIAGGVGGEAGDGCGDDGAGAGAGGDNRTPTSGVSLDEPYVTRRGGGQAASSHALPLRPVRLQQRLDEVSAACSSACAGGSGAAEGLEGCGEGTGEVCTPVQSRPGHRRHPRQHPHHNEAVRAAAQVGADYDNDVVDLLTPTGVTPGVVLGGAADGGVLLPPGVTPAEAAAACAAAGDAPAAETIAAAAVLYSGFDPPLAAVATVRKRLVRNDQRGQQQQQVEASLEDELEDSDAEEVVVRPQRTAQQQSAAQQQAVQQQEEEEALEDELEDQGLDEPEPMPPPSAHQSQRRRRLRQGPGASTVGDGVNAGTGTQDPKLDAAVRRGPALLAAAAAPPPRPSLANSSVSVGSLRSMWQQRQEDCRAASAAGQSRRPQLGPHHRVQPQAPSAQQQEGEGADIHQQASSSAAAEVPPPARRAVPQRQPQQMALAQVAELQLQQHQEPAAAAATWQGVRIKPDPGAPAQDEGLPLGPRTDLVAPPLPASLLGPIPAIKSEPGTGAGRPGASERRRAAAMATSSLVLEPEPLAASAAAHHGRGHHGAAADEVAAAAKATSRRRQRRAAVAAAFQATPTLEDLGLGPDGDDGDDAVAGGGAVDGDGGDGDSGFESAADLDDDALAESQSTGDTRSGGSAHSMSAGAAAANGAATRAVGGACGQEVSTPPGADLGAAAAREADLPAGALGLVGQGRLGPQAGPATINRMLTLRTGGLTPLPAAQRRPLMPRTDWSESDSEAGADDDVAAPAAAQPARKKQGKVAAAAAVPPTVPRARKGAKAAAAAAAAARAYGDSDATVTEEDADEDEGPGGSEGEGSDALLTAAGRSGAAHGRRVRASIATASSSAMLHSQHHTSGSQALSYCGAGTQATNGDGDGDEASAFGGDEAAAAFTPPALTDDRSISRYLRKAARMAEAYLRSLLLPAEVAASAGAGGDGQQLLPMLRDADVTVVKALSRPPRSHTVREAHPGVPLKSVEFAEQVMLEPLKLLLNCRDRSRRARCPILALTAAASGEAAAGAAARSQQQQQQQQQPQGEEVFLAEPCVMYRLPCGEWWLEYYRYWSEADLAALAAARGRPLNVPVDFVGRRELMRDTDRAHCRLTAVRGDLGVMRTKKPPPAPAGGRGAGGAGGGGRPAFCRFIFDSHTGEALTNQPVSDFVSG